MQMQSMGEGEPPSGNDDPPEVGRPPMPAGKPSDKRRIEAAYFEKYRKLGFTDEEISDIIVRIVEDR